MDKNWWLNTRQWYLWYLQHIIKGDTALSWVLKWVEFMIALKLEYRTHMHFISINTSRLGQNGLYFTDDIYKCIFLNENVWIVIKILLKFVPKCPINNTMYYSTGSDNGLALSRQQTIIWSNDGLFTDIWPQWVNSSGFVHVTMKQVAVIFSFNQLFHFSFTSYQCPGRQRGHLQGGHRKGPTDSSGKY